jgi:serine/threonine protein phosphatase PrpC
MATQLSRPADAELDVHGVTHPGLVRGRNEDHFLIGTVGRTLHVLQTSVPDVPRPAPPSLLELPELPEGESTACVTVVADGVGGGSRGEEAARLAVQMIIRFLAAGLHGQAAGPPSSGDTATAGEDRLVAALTAAARHSHAELRRVAAEAGSTGMATTLTLWFGVWPRAYVLQVGDSRAYHYHDGELTQVSRDQTVAEELVQHGVLNRVQAAATRWAHVLSSALGGPANSPVVTTMHNHLDSVHLLCSDGLTKHVSDEQIRERLASMTSARQACEALLQDALDGGGTDNITIIVGRVCPSGVRVRSR